MKRLWSRMKQFWLQVGRTELMWDQLMTANMAIFESENIKTFDIQLRFLLLNL